MQLGCSTKQQNNTTSESSAINQVEIQNAEIISNSVPLNLIVKCDNIPLVRSGAISDVKTAYLITQDKLIDMCLRHSDLVDFLEGVK